MIKQSQVLEILKTVCLPTGGTATVKQIAARLLGLPAWPDAPTKDQRRTLEDVRSAVRASDQGTQAFPYFSTQKIGIRHIAFLRGSAIGGRWRLSSDTKTAEERLARKIDEIRADTENRLARKIDEMRAIAEARLSLKINEMRAIAEVRRKLT